ncbi:ABC transporter substrate-binding protein [Mesorhizobium sp.]|uniref:ABC transporter substrate-binding protein n=1 Tax=Mesorhizobium sp. TaxID=1871066 RepID=UPI00257E6CA9|nr:ABC transporter substrate-binding protein [Mesorhizobium sp.]
MKWADGSPLTAADVVASWKFVMGGNAAGVAFKGSAITEGVVKSISETDGNAIQITTAYPTQSILNRLEIVPQKVWGISVMTRSPTSRIRRR